MTGKILQTVQPFRKEAFAPLADDLAGEGNLVGNLVAIVRRPRAARRMALARTTMKYGGVRGNAFLSARRGASHEACGKKDCRPEGCVAFGLGRRCSPAFAFGSGAVASKRSGDGSVTAPVRGCSLLASSPKPKAPQRTSPYLCLRPLRDSIVGRPVKTGRRVRGGCICK